MMGFALQCSRFALLSACLAFAAGAFALQPVVSQAKSCGHRVVPEFGRHAHHLVGNTVSFLFESIVRATYDQLGLQSAIQAPQDTVITHAAVDFTVLTTGSGLVRETPRLY